MKRVTLLLTEGLCHASESRRRPGPLPVFNMGAPLVNLADRNRLERAMAGE